MTRTRTDSGSPPWRSIDDEPTELREWATERSYELPVPTSGEAWLIGSSAGSWLRLQDRFGFVSRTHARLERGANGWNLHDAGSKNGLWLDGQRQVGFPLVPGAEIEMGRVRLVIESPRIKRARALLFRWFGWNALRRVAIDQAQRAVREYIAARAPIILSGDNEDLVALARHLHREAIGSDRPFVVFGAKRTTQILEIARAAQHAARGTLCVHADRLPDGFATAFVHARESENHTRLVLCSRANDPDETIDAGQVRIPALSTRPEDLDRLADEYALDAIVQLGAKSSSFTAADHEMVVSSRPSSLFEIATATLRLVAIREFGGVTRAAPHLGVSHGALSRWVTRRMRRRGS